MTVKVRNVHQAALMSAAERLGIEVIDHMPVHGKDLVTYQRGATRVTVFDGRYEHSTTAFTHMVTDDKALTKRLLAEAGFNAPAGVELDVNEAGWREAVQAAFAGPLEGRTCVVKPVHGEYGRGIRMGVRDAQTAIEQIAALERVYDDWIIEAEVEGDDLRVQIVGGSLRAACIRRPAFVVGDGRTALSDLIDARRQEVGQFNKRNRLDVDEEMTRLLDAQSVRFDNVIEEGREIRLKQTANMAKGGIAIDVTDELHPAYYDWAAAVSQMFQLPLMAIDAVSADRSLDPADGAQILEVNTVPDWLHHTFSQRRTHDIAGMILQSWFEDAAP